jgi:hypothetical protein
MATKKRPRTIQTTNAAPGAPVSFVGTISRESYDAAVQDPQVQQMLQAAQDRWGSAFASEPHRDPESD